jgi:carboxyl-terminal processing protease
MEQAGRWGEAIAHYEQAVRRFPERRDLHDRLTLVRTHYDLARRYGDTSFLDSLAVLGEDQALQLYSEVAVKIQSHYVHPPDWQALVSRGTYNLEVALTEPTFVGRHLAGVPQRQVEGFLRDLRLSLGRRLIRSHSEAVGAVQHAAQLGWQQVGLVPTATILEYSCGATAGLDEFSTYLTASQLDDVYAQIEGNFVGLGIELKASDSSLLIVNVIAGGPAARAGIQPQDRIIEVDGQPTRDVSTDRAADMLKGESGSSVNLTVLRADNSIRRLQVTRERVDVPSVEGARIVDAQAGTGYIKLTSFQKTTSRDMDAALWQLHRQGMKSLILDLRGNPGGLLTESVEVADKFIASGTIVSTRGRSPREDFDYKAHNVGTWSVPLVVLIDGDSASASEIFAGAVRDQRRGLVVGQRSYGKGSVQGIFPLSVVNAGIRLTTAKFYAPSGQPISHQGVEPDVVVRSTAKPIEPGAASEAPAEDAVLAAGIELARQRLAQR